MATRHVKRNMQMFERQVSISQDQDKSPSKSSSCKSVHLKKMPHPQEQTTFEDKNIDSKHSLTSPSSNTPSLKIENCQLKRKRSQNEGSIIFPEKRLRSSSPQPHTEDTMCENTATCEKKIDPLEYWTKELCWPKEYFEPESNMNHLLARKRSSSSLHNKQFEAVPSASSFITPSDQKPREVKSAPYQSPQYNVLLETKGSFMRKSELGITDTSKTICRTLLEAEQIVPEHSLFQDDIFEETCEMIQDRNEAKVIQDIARLIVPSAQFLAIHGAKHLKPLIESINEGWNSSIPVTKPRPQPDYAVGFKRTAFTEDQLQKMQPFIGGFSELSLFLGTYYMYFPFLTCEVKCGAGELAVADRQNAHSMTLAVRGTVELFKLVKREKELHREILAFSISHNDHSVRIYGHYPIINEKKITFHRHPIHDFSIKALDGKEKWTAYKFTKNVYDTWMPTHLKRICSVIDELPSDLNFEVSQQSELGESGLSQGSESHNSFEQTSSLKEADDQSSHIGSGHISPNTLLSQDIEGKVFQKPRKRSRNQMALSEES